MRHTETGYISQNFWYGILVCLIVVCLFLASAEPDETQSETQETTDQENQSTRQMIQQDIRDIIAPLIRDQKTLTNHTTILIETQETLTARTTIYMVYMVILGILLFAILLTSIWLFFQYRNLHHELNNVKHQIEFSTRVNNSLKQDLSDISNRIQKLATENQDIIQEILKLLKPTVDEAIIEVSAPSQEESESPEQIVENTSDLKLPLPIAEPCDHYNTGVQDKEVSALSQEELEPSEQIAEDSSDLKLTPAIADLCARYNAGIQDQNKRNDFLQRYHNSYKIYVENATARRVKQQIDPVFKTHHAAGDFLGCYVEEEKLYVVVPAYQLRIVHEILHYGAFVDVFECHEHEFDDPDGCYEAVRIIRPAIFEPDDAKETWRLQSKGMLELKEV